MDLERMLNLRVQEDLLEAWSVPEPDVKGEGRPSEGEAVRPWSSQCLPGIRGSPASAMGLWTWGTGTSSSGRMGLGGRIRRSLG